jgi:hypothetical protein
MITEFLETSDTPHNRGDEDDDYHEDETDDGITNHIDRWVDFVFITSRDNKQKSSPEHEDNSEDDSYEEENSDTKYKELFEPV